MIETITLALSYPLRLMATYGAVGILRLFGVDVTADRTLITMGEGGSRLAVTDACSGIEQLFALVLVGAVFAFMMQKSWLIRGVHWAFILPSVVLANIIRLIVTVVLVGRFGEVILGDTWHHGLGYAQTVLALIFLWLFGKALHVAEE